MLESNISKRDFEAIERNVDKASTLNFYCLCHSESIKWGRAQDRWGKLINQAHYHLLTLGRFQRICACEDCCIVNGGSYVL